MPDQKISQLTDGAPAQSGDQIPVNRSGTNVRITAGNIAALATTTPLTVPGTAGATGALRLAELTGNGTNYVALAAPSSIAADLTWTLPATDGTNGQALTTNGSGTLSWATASAAAGSLTGTTLASNVVSSSLTSVGTLSSLTVSGAASIQTLAASGQSLTGSQATSLVDLAATWNTTGTPSAIKLNVTDTASNAASLLMDLQRGGNSRMSVDKNGVITTAANFGTAFQSLSFGAVTASPANAAVWREGGVGSLVLRTHAQNLLWVYGDAGSRIVAWPDAMGLWWTNGSPGSFGPTLALWRDADNIFAQRNSTNAQTFRLYNTFTDASNYERGKLEWASNVLRIGTEKLGTGTARALEFQTDGTTRVTVAATTGNITATGDVLTIGGANNNGLSSASFGLYLRAGGTDLTLVSTSSFQLANNQRLTFGALDDLHLHRDAADTLAQRRTTNAQTFNIYNTFTSATNYERLSIAATAAGAVRIRTNKGSGGGTARALELGTDDTTRLTVKVEGQTRFIPLTADPANAEDGDVYYNSTTNKLRVRAGGAWVDLH